MAESRRQREIRCEWESVQDRHASEKLALVYKILVPAVVAPDFINPDELAGNNNECLLVNSSEI